MNTTIYKYPLDEERVGNIISAPIFKPLKVDYQNGIPMLWAIINEDAEPEEWRVLRIGTGWPVAGLEFENYLNTTVAQSEPFVWHWFCSKLVEGFDM